MHDNARPTTVLAPLQPATRRAIGEHHPIRSRFNAAFFHAIDWYMHWKYARLKARLFGGLPPVVVEIGAGAGANFRYLRRGTTVIAAEPNVHMHAAMTRRASEHGIELDIRQGGAEALDVDSASVDAVVSSLVLCTVRDPEASLREIVRVLRPGGRFVCIEHVAADPSTIVGRIQRLVFRPWRWIFEGCHTYRDTAGLLRRAGFSDVQIQAFTCGVRSSPSGRRLRRSARSEARHDTHRIGCMRRLVGGGDRRHVRADRSAHRNGRSAGRRARERACRDPRLDERGGRRGPAGDRAHRVERRET